jgi:hypothetical protein
MPGARAARYADAQARACTHTHTHSAAMPAPHLLEPSFATYSTNIKSTSASTYCSRHMFMRALGVAGSAPLRMDISACGNAVRRYAPTRLNQSVFPGCEDFAPCVMEPPTAPTRTGRRAVTRSCTVRRSRKLAPVYTSALASCAGGRVKLCLRTGPSTSLTRRPSSTSDPTLCCMAPHARDVTTAAAALSASAVALQSPSTELGAKASKRVSNAASGARPPRGPARRACSIVCCRQLPLAPPATTIYLIDYQCVNLCVQPV